MKINRFERKWIYENKNYYQLIIALQRSNFYFMNSFPERQVNSLYFDDMHYSSIRQNIEGVSEKKKFRIRWYGKTNLIDNPVFEIKSKKGFEVTKKIFSLKNLNQISIEKLENIKIIENYINNKFKFKNKISAILTTHYKRSYFVSLNNLVRATLDNSLQSIFLEKRKDMNIIKNYDDIILELKYDTDLDDYVRKNLKNISSRLSKNSKFVNSAILNASSYY